MAQLRNWLWHYFEQHHRAPEPTSTFYQMLDMAQPNEIGPIAMEVAAMRIVEYMHGAGKDATPEQQVQGIVPLVREAMRIAVTSEVDWHTLE